MTKYRNRFYLPPLSTDQALLLEQILEALLLAIDESYGDDIAELQAHLDQKPPHPRAEPHIIDDLDDIF